VVDSATVDSATLDLAIIGNCQVSALIDRGGNIVWACWPRPDADPIFCALLDQAGRAAGRGMLGIELRAQSGSQQGYVRNTAVVTTRLMDAEDGEILITDFCPRFHKRGRAFRPAVLVRIIEPIRGRPFVRVRLHPRLSYGQVEPVVTTGSHHLRFVGDGVAFRVTTDASLAALELDQEFVLDRPVTLLLGPDETVEEQINVLANNWLAETKQYWCDWVRTLAVPFEWQEAVIRAAITLKLCTYEDTGAVLAALTTSIPEAPGTGRNWDYRYCWLRDAFFVVQALNRLGATRTMEGFLRFIEHIASSGHWDQVRPLYRISGLDAVEETLAPALEGYRGSGPVRVGNQAVEQRQYDVYGSLVLASAQSFFDERLSARGDLASFMRLELIGAQAVQAFCEPDAGPWELRGITRAHTFSAMMCWAACDRLARIAEKVQAPDRAMAWAAEAARMRQVILARAWSDARDSYVSTLDGSTELDATLLLMPELGLIGAQEPQFLKTLAAIENELLVNGYVMRYRHADNFGVPSTAFTVCTFWYVNALAMVGRHADAIRCFETILARRNHVGLLSEDVDPTTGELWGNYPQTYSLVGIITSAIRLSRPWEAAI
jgi:GH15 family glucan-1,4-alpha-glucosidase